MSFLRPRWPVILLACLGLASCWPLVLHPTQILYSDSSDLIIEHLPAKLFLVRSLRETGELPLWCPEQFSGSPFVHDIQIGLFYPPNAPLYFISESSVGPFLSWLVVGHIILAGLLMYGYGRHAGLSQLAAFTAGLGYMLAPRWMMQLLLAGHTITMGLAWLPLVILSLERAIQRRGIHWLGIGSASYAMMILGTHPQYTFYASLLVGFWPLRLITHRRQLMRWLMIEAIVVILGIGLAAVQLLPTLEASRETTRALGVESSGSVMLQAWLRLIGPFSEAVPDPVLWESGGGVGLCWGVLAIASVVICGKPARIPTIIAASMLVYALGGSVLIDRLPGFKLFRLPTRMLLTLTFPMAFLVALSIDKLAAGEWSLVTRNLLMKLVSVLTAISFFFTAFKWLSGNMPTVLNAGWIVYWLLIPTLMLFLLWKPPSASSVKATRYLVALLVLDLFVIIAPYPQTRAFEDLYVPSPITDYLQQHRQSGDRVYDPDGGDELGRCFLGQGSPNASVFGIPSVRGYRSMDVARYRQFLAFVNGEFDNIHAFSSPFSFPGVPAFELKEPQLFHLLGAKYVIAPGDDSNFANWPVLARAEQAVSYNAFAGGLQTLKPHTLYQNPQAFPRAFMVGETKDMNEPNFFWNVVFGDLREFAFAPEIRSGLSPGQAIIRIYQPNHIVINLDGRSSGLLVVTDPWYPGWHCTIDGKDQLIVQADYAFRGVWIEKGTREVSFHFEPDSYRWGKRVSFVALGVIGILFFGILLRRGANALRLA